MLPEVLAGPNAAMMAEEPRRGKPVPGLIPLSPRHFVQPRALPYPCGITCPAVHPAPVPGQPGSGPLLSPHSLDREIQHTAKRLCDKHGRYKPVSKPFSPSVHLLLCTKMAETLLSAPLEFLSKCAEILV